MKTGNLTRRHFHELHATALLVCLFTHPAPAREKKATFTPHQPHSFYQKQAPLDPPGRPYPFINYI
jgi:hypothetical protein